MTVLSIFTLACGVLSLPARAYVMPMILLVLYTGHAGYGLFSAELGLCSVLTLKYPPREGQED